MSRSATGVLSLSILALTLAVGSLAWARPSADESPQVEDTAGSTVETGSEPPSPPFPFTPRHLLRAGERLGDRELLIGLGVGSLAALAVSPADDATSEWFVEHQPLGPDAEDIGWYIGHRKTVAAGTLLLVGGGLALGSPHVRDTGLLFLESHLVVAGVTELLKTATGRTRPDGSNDKSLPSGHASSAMTSARVLQMRFGWWVGAPAYLLAAYSGLSRVQAEKHYLSDVILGWSIAWYFSSAIVRAAEPAPGEKGYEESSVAWLPRPEPGDEGIALLRVRF